MERLKNLFVALVLCAPLTAVAQNIAINEENFPDANFRSNLLAKSVPAVFLSCAPVILYKRFAEFVESTENFIKLAGVIVEFLPKRRKFKGADFSFLCVIIYINVYVFHLSTKSKTLHII